jgi:hypothetical protein
VTLSGPRDWRLLHISGTVKLLLSPGKAGGLPKENYFMKKLMTILIYTIFLFLIIGISFAGGVFYKKLTIAQTNKFILKKSLTIQSGIGGNKLGKIPKGTVLYEFKNLPETSIYFMFISMKYMDQLEPYNDNLFNSVIPVSAFSEPESAR